MKAMILAAGRGKRLRPLTDDVPKPLIKAGGETLIERNLKALAKAGFKDVVINVAYRAEEIIEALGDGSKYGVNIQYSIEEEDGLETGGGIFNALPLLGDEPFAVVNCDLYTEYDFANLRKHPSNLAHLILVNPQHGYTPDYSLDDQNKLDQEPEFTFAGIGVYDPKIFEGRELGRFQLAAVINDAAQKGQVTGEVTEDKWFNIGAENHLSALREYLG